MSADLEIQQGSVSYAQADGEPAPWWQGMDDMRAVIVPKGAGRNQWELAANFNFDVTMEEMVTLVGGTRMVKDEARVLRPVRTWRGGANDGQVDLLGKPFTEDYGLVTPSDVLDFAETIVSLANDSGIPAYLATLGSVRNGNRMFASVNLGDISVKSGNGFNDITRGYLSISNTFDGSSPFVVSNDDIRIVCANTQSAVLRNVANIVKAEKGTLRGNFISGKAVRLKHTKRVADRMQDALKAIAEHNKWKTAYELYAKALMEAKMTDAAFNKMVEHLVVTDGDDTRTVNNNDRKVAILKAAWNVETQHRTGKCAWSALNAFTDLTSHASVAKGTDLTPMAQLEIRHGFVNSATSASTGLIDQVNDYLARVIVKA